MSERNGDRIQLISGKPFWPLDARPDEVEIRDIAWALSMQCRFAGHVLRRYSVAEHSVMVSCVVEPEHALWGLLHDATEAYLVDVPRPVKRSMPGYREHEDRLSRVIAERFGLPWPMPEAVKLADNRMLMCEREHLLVEPERHWDAPIQMGVDQGCRKFPTVLLPCWSPDDARGAFLSRFSELT